MIKVIKEYKGPYKILEILRNNNVKLAISGKWTRIVHSHELKICRNDRAAIMRHHYPEDAIFTTSPLGPIPFPS